MSWKVGEFEEGSAAEVTHPPAEILERTVKGRGKLCRLDYWERYTFLNQLYLAYNPEITGDQLEPIVDGHLHIRRAIAAAEGVFGAWSKTREWLMQPDADLGGAPIGFLGTPDGARLVADELNRRLDQMSIEERREIQSDLPERLSQEPTIEAIIDEIEALDRDRVETLAVKVFQNAEKANAWLDQPWEEGPSPREMMRSKHGLRLVERALVQIDEGISS
jgi:uncharacterized protein (DUF2384 family)